MISYDRASVAVSLDEKLKRYAAGRSSLLEWTIKYRPWLAPKIPFDLPGHRYLAGIYECRRRVIVIMKAGQTGISEWAISDAYHAAIERKLDTFYMMPTDSDVTDFSRMRFAPAVEASPYLAGFIISGRHESSGRRGADLVSLKRIGDSWIIFRGAQVDREGYARQLKAVPADRVVADEFDEMDSRALEIARKRYGHSHAKEERIISTPSYVGMNIHQMWEQSDMREWHVPCSHCNHWQQITIDHIVLEWDDLGLPERWHGDEAGDAWAACEKCGKQLNRLARGQWVKTYAGREWAGFRPTKLFSAQTPLIEVIGNLRKIDETSRKEAYNQDLALPYTPKGGQLTREILDACRREYGHGPIADVRPFAGIDVGSVLHIVIRAGRDAFGERRQLWAGEVATFAEAERVLKTYRVKGFVVDAAPEVRKARELQDAFPAGVGWLAYYRDGEDKKESPYQWNSDEGIVSIERTRSLDEMYAGFYDQETNTLPAHARDIPNYYDHLTAPVRVLERDRKGNERARYVEGTRADHFAHAENYCLAAESRPPGTQASRPRVVRREELFQ